jgi:signal transduction histidine kinase
MLRPRIPVNVVRAALTSAVLVVIALGWTAVRFGFSDEALVARVEEDVRRRIDERTDQVVSLARAVSAESPLIDAASGSREQLADLFARLETLASPRGENLVSATVFVPATTGSGGFRVLAWSDGPGEQSLAADRLSGPGALFVAPGRSGLRLVAVEPVISGDRRLGAAVAETILAPATRQIPTSLGPVTIVERFASTSPAGSSTAFVVPAPDGTPLAEVQIDVAALHAQRFRFLRRLLAVALLPLAVTLSLVALLLAGRRRSSRFSRAGARSLAFLSAVVAAAVAYAGLARLAALPLNVSGLALAIGLLVLIAHLAGLLWRHTATRRPAEARPIRFVIEHLQGGAILAAGLEGTARLLDRWITINVLDRGPFVLLPVSMPHTIDAGIVLLLETAIGWTMGSLLGVLAVRWRLKWTRRLVPAVACWLLPVAALALLDTSTARLAGPTLYFVAIAAALAALFAASLRRIHRRSTRSARLLLTLLAGLAPGLLLYPLTAIEATRTTRHIVETSYAPATANHPEQLRAELTRAQERIDQMPGLEELVSGPPGSDSQAAYYVWSQTGLEQSRVISDVELYGPDRTLVSRFAFNLPEYVLRPTVQLWQGSNCSWEDGVFGERLPIGAEDRRMLHAERAICDAEGRLLGGVVVHVASDDYEALPFISSPRPYSLAADADAGPRLPGVRLVVSGWSFRPIYTSSVGSWAVPQEMFERLYATGVPFWTTVHGDSGSFDVHLSQNRAGIYAIGIPQVPLMEHVTRLAEIAVLVTVCFVIWQAVLLAHASLARQADTPLRQVLHEIRTSFYRRLFLSFVAIAVVPVVLAAVVFGGYMAARFRADVEYEAGAMVTVAQRVFQELTASAERSLQEAADPNDDVMVWIRQVLGNDVSLFDGPELRMTSQRDLVYSGFLPLRLPATVYRAVALERRPTFVTEDRIGPYSYVVAAAPVIGASPDTLLTVPLAPRQRELERARDTLNRRVLVGAVFVVLFAALVGASLAGRISDPVARLTRATRQIAAGRLDVRLATDSADELGRLVDDFNSMAATLGAQRDELARTHQLKAWNEMARQVAHEIKNPLTPIQLAAEHLQQVHTDRGRPLGDVLDRCIATVLAQVRLLRQIASEFANFAGEPVSRPTPIEVGALVDSVIAPYRVGLNASVTFDVQVPADLPHIEADRTLLARAFTNLVENAVQAMPNGGTLTARGSVEGGRVVIEISDTGVGMDDAALEHAFEPFFSTKTGGSGLGLANARRNIEREGGTVSVTSAPGQGTTLRVTFPQAAGFRPAPPENG